MTAIPVVYSQHPTDKNVSRPSVSATTHYSIQDHGQGHRTYSYEFDLVDYEPEQINVLLDDSNTLRIRASRSPFQEFRREYNLGGPNIETILLRNTIDNYGRLRVDIDARPRRFSSQMLNTNILTFDLHGYKPSNVNVRIDHKGLLKINALYVDNTYGNRINREYFRQYQLPANIDPNNIRARMDENQILTIELPAPSTQYYTKRNGWEPVYDKGHPSYYGSGPNGAYCCCNLM